VAIQHSSGVRELIEAIWAAADAQDGDQMARLHADDPCLIFVVPTPADAWQGITEVKDAIRAAHDGTSSVGFRLERCTAFEEGGMGWGVGDGFFTDEGRRYPYRLTVVAQHTESGVWKSLFSQTTIPIRDEAFSDALAIPETG
jgi:ketosteroid isomerase-like protein